MKCIATLLNPASIGVYNVSNLTLIRSARVGFFTPADLQAFPFACALQPLVHVQSGDIYGYELLYRGAPCVSWEEIDIQVLRYLAMNKNTLPLIFVNLSHQTLLNQPIELIIQASKENHFVFEISESQLADAEFAALMARINALIDAGVEFAVDDFGSGKDGLLRLYSMTTCNCVKIDGTFFKLAYARPEAEQILIVLIKHWKERGILTVAEWVETPDLLDFANKVGFDLVQGWHIDALVKMAA
jgi:EAL domain-containing protein (putative c-di-GMP-specific phosphodiesterase class I)